MLTDKYSLWDKLKILCNAKTKYEPIAKSYKYPWAFLVIWLIISGVAFGAIELQNIIITILQGILLVVILALFGSLVLGGRKEKNNPHTYT